MYISRALPRGRCPDETLPNPLLEQLSTSGLWRPTVSRPKEFHEITRSPIRIFWWIWCAHRKSSISPFYFGGRDTRRAKMMVFMIKNGSPKMTPRRTVMAPGNRKNQVRENVQLLRLFCIARIHSAAMISVRDDTHQNRPSSPSRYTSGKNHHFLEKVAFGRNCKILIHKPRSQRRLRTFWGPQMSIEL